MPSIASSGAAAHGSSGGGSSAAVLEFVCLFTHDLKRKQKRWQDGRLKYHTFNKRIMVYDERGNFVGDMHWTRDWDFDEGEEIELERGGVIVQVAECVGSRNQDLTELLDKRAKEKEERQLKAASRPSLLRPPIQSTPLHRIPNPQDHFQTRHRPLHQVIGTPTGHHGRAVVPTESPFEQRHNPAETSESRPQKRRRYDTTPPSKLGYAQSLFGAALTLSAVPMSSAPRRQPPPSRQHRPEMSSSPQDQHGGLTAADSSQVPVSSLPRLEPRARSASRPLPVASRDRNSLSHEASRSGGSADNLALREHGAARPGHGHGHSHHFSGPAARDTARPNPPDVRRGQARIAPRTEAGNFAAETGKGVNEFANERDFAVVVLEDDSDSTPMETSNIHGTRKTGAEIPAKAPLPLASKKELATKPKKTAPPRSPSRLGESAVNTASRPGAEKGIASADGSAKDKGKRTELRIKPRQKRGLLVASELPKQAKRPKVRKVSDEGSGHASLGTVGQVPLDSHKPGTETEQASPCPEDEDPFAYSPIRALKGNGAERRSKSPSPRSKRKGARDVAADSVVAVGPVARKKTAPSPREDEDPFASSPAVLGGRTARKRPSRSPLSVSKQNTNAMGSLRASTSPRRATALTGDRPVVVTGRSTAAMYDMPDDTDDEYFGILPTPVQGREDLVPARRSAKAATKKSSKSVKPMVFRSSSPDMDASSHSPRPISRGGDMQKNGTRSPSVQIESSEEDLPRARRRVRRPVNDEEFPQLPVGPRLARLGRNVKSKEVIGYVRLNSPDEEEQEASPAASERGHPGGFSPTTGNFSPDWSVSRESATAKRVASPVEDTPSRLEGYEESTAVVLGRSAAASAGSRAAVVLRRQNSLPETTRLPGLNEHARGGRKSPDGQASRPGLTRHRSVVTAEEYETEGILAPTTAAARIVQAVTHGKVDLPVADPPPAIEVGNSATGQNAVQLAPHQPDDLPQHRLKPGNATCSIKPVCTTGGVVGGAPSDESPVTVPSNPPRIVNPATRGRKAALKSHAAGQVPQSILPPTDPVPARLVARSGPETRQGPSGNERPKRKMTFPGFMSAKGQGPWSREAHDLLDRGHPLS